MKAVFLDRDGVVNELIFYDEHGILDSPFAAAQMKVFPWVSESIVRLKELGYKVVIVSNQPGIAKGYFTRETFQKIRKKMLLQIGKDGAKLDGEYYCFHHPEAKIDELRKDCDCRKPGPGLIFKAAKELDIDLNGSWMIGDGITDVKAGAQAGLKTIFIGKMRCDFCQVMKEIAVRPDFVAKNLFEAAKIIETEAKE